MTDILIPKKNIILDSQILSTVMSCARLTDFRFNHHFVSVKGKSTSLEMGSIVHAALEGYYCARVDGTSHARAVEMGMTYAQQYITSTEHDLPTINNSTQEDIDLALKTSEEYFDYYKSDFWTPLEVELVKGKVIYEDEEIRILWKAKFDLIVDTTQGIYPIDHKTMKQRRDSLSLNNQFMGQCILSDTRMMIVNKIGFQKSLKREEKFTRVPVNYTADRLLEWQSIIVPFYAKLMLMYEETGYWPPNFTHCENKYGFCAFKNVCEIDRNTREEILGQEFTVGKPWDITND